MNFKADDFDHHDLLNFANEWVALGSEIQEQVEYICNVDPEEQHEDKVSKNAIVHAKRSGIYGVCEEIDDAIDSYIEFQQQMAIEDARGCDIDAEVDEIESIEKELNPETEECAPTAEAIRLIQGGDPWAAQPVDEPPPDVICKSTRPDGRKVELTVPPKKTYPVTRSDGQVVNVTIPPKD